jgi:hypothetical protein
MSRSRTVALAAVSWCAVVAVVASLVWVVIDRAGQGVVPVSQAELEPSGTPSVRPTTTGPPGPSGHRSRGVTASAPTRTSTTSPTTPTGRPAAFHVGSWSGTAGHLVARCRGLVGGLVSAYPNAGWRYVIEARGPSVVRVRYLRIGEDRSTTVSARCSDGVPQFSVGSDVPGED